MGGFDEKSGYGAVRQNYERVGFGWVEICKFSVVLAVCLIIAPTVEAEEKGKVVVLPFRIHTLEPLDHLKQGLQEVFSTRLAEKGFHVIGPETVNKHVLAFLPVLELKDMLAIGKDLGSDWIIVGSLTQIGRKISLDLKVVDVASVRPPFSVFMVEEDIDNLADAADRATGSIYNQIAGVVQIDSVLVKGNNRIESEAILAAVESKKGDVLDYDQLDKDLRAIYGMGFFRDVHIETEDGPKGKIVSFNVAEKPSISKLSFEGNKEEKDEDLRKESGIRLYSILNRNEIRQSIERLKEYYRQKGFYNVEIHEKITELPTNEVTLTYEVEEGEKVYITKIEFVGNTQFDDDDLKDIMETSEKGFLSWLLKSGLLEGKTLEFDIHKITSFYHNRGYIKARAGEPKITYEKDKGLTITIEIIEGHQYRVNEVSIEGDLIKPADKLLEEVSIRKENFFNREVVRKDMMTLREIYADQGYAYADVSPTTREDDENHLVDIAYHVSKGEKVRFERINITGNTITRDKVIRRELRVVEGEYFSGNDLKRSIGNLHRLGFFDDVEVQTRKGTQDDQMMLDVKVKERATGSFSVGAGYSSAENALGMFTIAQNNLFGYGQKLAASVRIGGRSSQFDIKFTEPWLLDKPVSAGIEAFKWEYEYDEYTKDSLGGALRFGFPLDPLGLDEYSRGSLKYAYDDADITDIEPDAAQEIRDMEGRNVTSSFTTGIARDTKDKPWNTKEGSLNKFTFEYAGGFLGGDVAFNKYLARSAWYFPLPWRTVIMAQGRWGLVDGRSGGKLPIYQKFRIGGINTVRGFDSFSISPRDPETGDRIGGEKMMIYNLEYRFPLPLFQEQGVSGVVFFDAGNVFTDDEGFTFSDIKRSAGAGIRWYSPVGPLRLEYGKNLDPQGDEVSGNWEFSMGGTF